MHGVRDSVRERGAAAPHQVRQVSHSQQEAPRPPRKKRHESLPRPGGERGILVLHLPLLQGNSDSILSGQRSAGVQLHFWPLLSRYFDGNDLCVL